MLSLMMGITFEIPILTWLLAKLGILSVDFIAQYRKHAWVVAMIIAAIITPTSDVFTMLIVTFPIVPFIRSQHLSGAPHRKEKTN